MESHEAFTDVLTDADFSKYEAEVYLSVLELTDASAADIAEISTVPRSRVYDVLRDLETQGYQRPMRRIHSGPGLLTLRQWRTNCTRNHDDSRRRRRISRICGNSHHSDNTMFESSRTTQDDRRGPGTVT
ncbi:helix-turn-helix domain-containing protein [Halomicroarcula sp. GCM10025710]